MTRLREALLSLPHDVTMEGIVWYPASGKRLTEILRPLLTADWDALDGPERQLAAALLRWYDTTHGNDFGHDHHCPVPWSENPHVQPPDDRCTCGWSGVLVAEQARFPELT